MRHEYTVCEVWSDRIGFKDGGALRRWEGLKESIEPEDHLSESLPYAEVEEQAYSSLKRKFRGRYGTDIFLLLQ